MELKSKYNLDQVVYLLRTQYLHVGFEVYPVKIKQLNFFYDIDKRLQINYQVFKLNEEHNFDRRDFYANEKELFANKQELKQALNQISDMLIKTRELTDKGLPEVD